MVQHCVYCFEPLDNIWSWPLLTPCYECEKKPNLSLDEPDDDFDSFLRENKNCNIGLLDKTTSRRVEKSYHRALLYAMNDISSRSDFAHFDRVPDYCEPKLVVDQCGPIQLPLSDVDARRIIGTSHQAPFGKGAETIIDTNVRRTWELNSDQFTIQHDGWQKTLSQVLSLACCALAASQDGADVKAEPYKLLLYEKGALFKPHTDTEKVPGMFGTLIICLPSAHTGGEIVLSHCGQRKTFSTADLHPSFAAWYSDVRHEVKEVTSGYRLVLTYNLVKTSPKTTKLNLGSEMKLMYSILRRGIKLWSLRPEFRDPAPGNAGELIYVLDHKYTDASDSLDSLKGADFARANALAGLAERLDFSVYLGSMEYTVSGGCDEEYGMSYRGRWDDEESEKSESDGDFHPIVEEVDRSIKLRRIMDLDGSLLVCSVELNEDSVLQDMPFEDRDPDEEDYEGYTGNAGASATHWYRDTVLVLVPKKHNITFLTRSFDQNVARRNWRSKEDKADITTLLQAYISKLGVRPHDADVRNEAELLCDFVVSKNSAAYTHREKYGYSFDFLPGQASSLVVTLLLALSKTESLVEAVRSTEHRLPKEGVQALAVALKDHDRDHVFAALDAAIDQYTTIDDALRVLQYAFGKELAKGETYFRQWIEQRLIKTLETCASRLVRERDGTALADMAIVMETEELLRQHVLPHAVKLAVNTRFGIGFLSTWHLTSSKVFSDAMAQDAVDQVWSAMQPRFNLDPTPSQDSSNRYSPMSYRQNVIVPSPEDTALNLASLLEAAMYSPQAEYASTLYAAIAKEAKRLQSSLVREILVWALRHFHVSLKDAPAAQLDNLREMYTTVLYQFCVRYVGKQPDMRSDWSRPRVNCSCGDCRYLNSFLVGTTQSTGRFPMGNKRRLHLHQMLGGSDCAHTTERGGNPQTLVVTKRDRKKAAYEAWVKRRGEARTVLLEFEDHDCLRTLLKHPVTFESLVSMQVLISDPTSAAAKTSSKGVLTGTEGNRNPPARAGDKRKVDDANLADIGCGAKRVVVIDLCSDSE